MDDVPDDFDKYEILKGALPGHFSSFDDGPPLDFTFGEGLFKSFDVVTFKVIGAEYPLDLITASQKWHEFVVKECGQEAPDPKTVADLAAKHVGLFQAAISGHGASWDGLSGTFTAPSPLWAEWSSQGTGLAVEGAVFEIWNALFEQTVYDHYDEIVNKER
jgi:hypothetical protein